MNIIADLTWANSLNVTCWPWHD